VSGSWGCPHEVDGLCRRLGGPFCDPGMRGCVLDGKVEFTDGRVHVPRWPANESEQDDAPPAPGAPTDGGRRR